MRLLCVTKTQPHKPISMKTKKLVPMVQFILDIDAMTTKEFCDKFNLPHPFFTGEVESSANLFLQVDAIKHRMFVEYAKFLNKNITANLLLKVLGFENTEAGVGNETYKYEKYVIRNDKYGYWVEPYDSVDGFRVKTISDLVGLNVCYIGNGVIS